MCIFPSQYVVTLSLSSSSDLKCRACYSHKYFIPKLSTVKVKFIRRLLCVQSPRVILRNGTHKVLGV